MNVRDNNLISANNSYRTPSVSTHLLKRRTAILTNVKNVKNQGTIGSPIFKNHLLPNLYMEEKEMVKKEKEAVEKGIPIPERTGDTPLNLEARLKAGRDLFTQIPIYGNGKIYIGRRGEARDKDLASEKKRGRVLKSEVWSIGINDAFIYGAIDVSARGRVWFLSDHDKAIIKKSMFEKRDLLSLIKSYENKSAIPTLWREETTSFPAGESVSAREIGQFIENGYVFSTVKLNSKGKSKTKEVFFPNKTAQSVYLHKKRIRNKMSPLSHF